MSLVLGSTGRIDMKIQGLRAGSRYCELSEIWRCTLKGDGVRGSVKVK